MNKGALVIGAVLLGGGAVAGMKLSGGTDQPVTVSVSVPDLSRTARRGETVFDANCAACHGKNASGTDQGPPLVHNIYNPGHHADGAFHVAVTAGVRQHHWPYGNMPRQPQVGAGDVNAIIAYVRELQAANGIVYQQHNM